MAQERQALVVDSTPLWGITFIEDSGGLFAQRSYPIGRWQTQRLAKLGDGASSEILKAEKHIVRTLAHLADGF
jgi:hypothetical protein